MKRAETDVPQHFGRMRQLIGSMKRVVSKLVFGPVGIVEEIDARLELLACFDHAFIVFGCGRRCSGGRPVSSWARAGAIEPTVVHITARLANIAIRLATSNHRAHLPLSHQARYFGRRPVSRYSDSSCSITRSPPASSAAQDCDSTA